MGISGRLPIEKLLERPNASDLCSAEIVSRRNGIGQKNERTNFASQVCDCQGGPRKSAPAYIVKTFRLNGQTHIFIAIPNNVGSDACVHASMKIVSVATSVESGIKRELKQFNNGIWCQY